MKRKRNSEVQNVRQILSVKSRLDECDGRLVLLQRTKILYFLLLSQQNKILIKFYRISFKLYDLPCSFETQVNNDVLLSNHQILLLNKRGGTTNGSDSIRQEEEV